MINIFVDEKEVLAMSIMDILLDIPQTPDEVLKGLAEITAKNDFQLEPVLQQYASDTLYSVE